MAVATNNNTTNVSPAKGVKGGYFYSIERTTANLALITQLSDLTKKVTDIFTDAVPLGYISEDGWTISEDRESNDFNDVNGDVVDTSLQSKTETIAATLIETKAGTLSEYYGHGNVSDAGGVITAYHTSGENDERIYIAELVLKNSRRSRVCAPDGKITELGDLTLNSQELVGREVTITALAYNVSDDITASIISWTESTETEKASGATSSSFTSGD